MQVFEKSLNCVKKRRKSLKVFEFFSEYLHASPPPLVSTPPPLPPPRNLGLWNSIFCIRRIHFLQNLSFSKQSFNCEICNKLHAKHSSLSMLTNKFCFLNFFLMLNSFTQYMQVLGARLWGNRPFFSSVVGQRKGPSGANAPPVHGIKKCLAL
jgi:hypothetical protein